LGLVQSFLKTAVILPQIENVYTSMVCRQQIFSFFCL